MDRHLTAGELARRLRTSIPRVHRAARAGIVPSERAPNGRLRFHLRAVGTLSRRWGWCPEIPGVGTQDTFVLAALSRRPLGLRSARAVARAAGVSPTTAQRVLRDLVRRGYVKHRTIRVAEGRALDAGLWEIRWGSPGWRRLAGDVGRCRLPEGENHRPDRVPRRLAHLFWNVDVDDLDPVRDGRYIADRILRDGDAQGLAWLASAVPSRAIGEAAHGRGLDRRRSALGLVLAS